MHLQRLQLTFHRMRLHAENAARSFHQRASVENSKWRPLLDHKFLLDVQLFQDFQCDVTFDGAQRTVNFLFVLFAGFDVMQIFSVGRLIDGEFEGIMKRMD